MKPCYRADALVSAYLEREASPAEMRFMEEHLSACPRCRETVDEVGSLLRTLPNLPLVLGSPDFTARVLARTHGLRAVDLEAPDVIHLPRRRTTWAVPLAAAAALAFAMIGVRAVRHGPVSEPAVAARGPAPATAIRGRETVAPSPGERAAIEPPEVVTFGKGESQSLGMVRDAYLVGTYELRAPAEGGSPILTRVSIESETPVVVSF